MGKEARKFFIEGEWITEEQVPQVFNLYHLAKNYQNAVQEFGKEVARERFSVLLKKQLASFIQEQVIQPLTEVYWYRVEKKEEEPGIDVFDDDYPQQPNLLKRSNPYLGYQNLGHEITEADGPAKLIEVSKLGKAFINRFILEFEQTRTLIDHLAQDPLLVSEVIKSLAEITTPLTLSFRDGTKKEGFVSNWYALGLPATKVHKGGGSYFNIYRIVAMPQDDSNFEYFVQKQGYFHKLKWKRQIQKLLNLDQVEQFIPQDEKEFMMKIIQLKPQRNRENPAEILAEIGVQAGDKRLLKKIQKARLRQEKQKESIASSAEAILEIFDIELEKPDGPEKDQRLKAFFEGIGNPLYFAKDVPKNVLVKSYKDFLATGKGRDAFIGSLVGFIPTILKRAGGWSICGALSAGGLVTKTGVNGFGGLELKKGEHHCPKCCRVSTSLLKCTNCGFANPRYTKTTSPSHFSSHNSSEKFGKPKNLGQNSQQSESLGSSGGSTSVTQFMNSFLTPQYLLRQAA